MNTAQVGDLLLDFDAKTVTNADGETYPMPDAMYETWEEDIADRAIVSAAAAQAETDQATALAAIATPIVAPAIEGTTVAAVRNSATAAVAAVVDEMNTRLAALSRLQG